MKRARTISAAGVGFAALSLLGLTAAPASATPVPVENATFSEPTVDPNGFLTLTSNLLPGWTVAPGTAVDLYGANLAHHPDGNQAVDLNAVAPAKIETVLRTTPGRTIRVQWDHAVNSYSGCHMDPTLRNIEETYTVKINNDATSTAGFTAGAPSDEIGGTTWHGRGYVFTATSTNTRLQFASTTASVCGPLITNVSADTL
jgi:hypothetical protein